MTDDEEPSWLERNAIALVWLVFSLAMLGTILHQVWDYPEP